MCCCERSETPFKNPTIESGFLCPFMSPASEQGFFIFGSATPFAPSWEVLLEPIYCAFPKGRNPDDQHAR
ncbi:hypothetical protein EMIT0P291_190105 [Pseudomonas sp. IT-P291]